jgi:hypothetical protein
LLRSAFKQPVADLFGYEALRLHSLPPSGTVVQIWVVPMSKSALTKTLEVVSGKSAYKSVIQCCLKC